MKLKKVPSYASRCLRERSTPEFLLDEILKPLFSRLAPRVPLGLIETGSYRTGFLKAAEVSEEQFPILAVSEKLIQFSTSEENQRSFARKLVDVFSKRGLGYPLPSAIKQVAFLDALEWAAVYYEIIRVATGERDPFKEVKKQANDNALSILPLLEQQIESATDPLLAAIQVGIIGNILDKGVVSQPDLESILHTLEAEVLKAIKEGQQWFTRVDYDKFLRRFNPPEQQVLFIMDNAGEAVFDLLLIKQLLARGHRVTLVGRGRPAVNDVTREDIEALLNQGAVAQYFQGIADWRQRFSVISSGSDLAGTNLRRATPEFIQAWLTSDIRIAKGQGNWETLGGPNALTRDVFHILLVKEPRMIRGAFSRGAKLLLYRPSADLEALTSAQWLWQRLGEAISPKAVVGKLASKLGRTGSDFEFWRLALQLELEQRVDGPLGKDGFRQLPISPRWHSLRIEDLLQGERRQPIEPSVIKNVLRELESRRYRTIKWFEPGKGPETGLPEVNMDLQGSFSGEKLLEMVGGKVGVGGSFVNGYLTLNSDIDLVFTLQGKPDWIFHVPLVKNLSFPDPEGFLMKSTKTFQGKSVVWVSKDRLLALEGDGLQIRVEALEELFHQNHQIRNSLREKALAVGKPLSEREIAEQAALNQQDVLNQQAGLEEISLVRALRQPSVQARLNGAGFAPVEGGFLARPPSFENEGRLFIQTGLEEPDGIPKNVPVIWSAETTVAGMLEFVKKMGISSKDSFLFNGKTFTRTQAIAVLPATHPMPAAAILDPRVRATAQDIAMILHISRQAGTVYVVRITKLTFGESREPLLFIQIQA